MRSELRTQRRWLYSGVFSALVWTGCRIAVPLLAAAAIDDGILKDDGHKIFIYAALIAGVGIFQALGTGLRRYTAFRIAYRIETDLRERLFAHLQRLHFAFHDRSQTGQLMARANSDIQQVNLLMVLFPLSVASVFLFIGVAVVMVQSSVLLTVFSLGALPLLSIGAAIFSQRLHPVSLALQQELGDLSGVVEETVAGVRVVKGFGTEERQTAQLEHEADQVLHEALAGARLRANFLPVVDFLPALALVIILGYGGHLVLAGQLQIGDLVAFNTYILFLLFPLRMAGMQIAQAARSSAAAGRINELLATDSLVADPPHPSALPADGHGEVRFEAVRFGYGTGEPVLDGLDLVIPAGEAVALVGATASGKTTVARLLPRFYDVDAGVVRLDGVDIRELKLRDLRRAIGIVFEDTFLFTDTVAENIAFAEPDASMDTVRNAARLAGADEFVEALPEGYDTLIGEHGYSLSGGQRQRIAIARAVLADPRVLILDDATSSVDPTKEHEIRSALREVMRDRTTVIIAHRAATIALADRVVLLDRGRAVAEGSHEELLASSERYRHILAQSGAIAPVAGASDG
jgi:ATP-binding cassette subfamily B protein